MTEREFMKQVMDLAKTRGWKVAHFGASVRVVGKNRTFVGDKDAAGFPDLILARRDRLVFMELKVGKNKPTHTQIAWMEAIKATGTEMSLVYPDDWDFIELILR